MVHLHAELISLFNIIQDKNTCINNNVINKNKFLLKYLNLLINTNYLCYKLYYLIQIFYFGVGTSFCDSGGFSIKS